MGTSLNNKRKQAAAYAPGVSIIANGSLQTAERTADALGSGADFVALGRGALANPDLPKIFETKREPRSFDSSILGPIANIKASELLNYRVVPLRLRANPAPARRKGALAAP